MSTGAGPGRSTPGQERVVAIIPARLGSTRFPRKVLANRTGKLLVQHVFEAASRASSVQRVVIATDSDEVARAVAGFGAEAIMTSVEHANGTSRLGEAAGRLGLSPRDIVVNVQGDEPEIEPEVIDAAVAALRASDAPTATVASPFRADENPGDPNLVKVVRRRDGCALYFSRGAIPYPRAAGQAPAQPLRHIGLYVYRTAFLRVYASLEPTPLEQTEVLEQLRILEHGHAMAVAVHPSRGVGIDTPEQYEAFVARYRAGSRT